MYFFLYLAESNQTEAMSARICSEIFLLTILIMGSVPESAAQFMYDNPGYEYSFPGKGARAAGMGYAFNSIADDVTAIHWNPAGIAQIKAMEAGLATRLTFNTSMHSLNSDRKYSPVIVPDFIGLVIPVKLFGNTLALGTSFQNEINYQNHYKALSLYGEKDEEYDQNTTVNTITVCGAYELSPVFLIGASFHGWFSLGNSMTSNTYYNSKMLDSVKYDYDEAFFDETEVSKYSGFSFSAGFLCDFTSLNIPLHFAFRFDSKKWLINPYEYEAHEDYIFEDSADIHNTELWGGTRFYFVSNIFALGLSYRFTDYLTLSCDFDYIPFHNSVYYWEGHQFYDGDSILIDTTRDGFYELADGPESLSQFRIGIEYILHPDFALIPLRIGWKTNPTCLSNYNEDKQETGQVMARSFNLGAGIIFKRYTLDLAYEYYAYDRKDYSYFTENARYHFLTLSGIVRF